MKNIFCFSRGGKMWNTKNVKLKKICELKKGPQQHENETEIKGKFETEIKSNKQLKHQKDNKAA